MKLSSGCPVRIQMERKTHLVSRTCCCVGVLKASHGQRTPSCWCVRASLFPCVLVFSVNGARRCSLFVVRCGGWLLLFGQEEGGVVLRAAASSCPFVDVVRLIVDRPVPSLAAAAAAAAARALHLCPPPLIK